MKCNKWDTAVGTKIPILELRTSVWESVWDCAWIYVGSPPWLCAIAYINNLVTGPTRDSIESPLLRALNE